MATCSDSDDKFSLALVLHIIYTDEGYSRIQLQYWKPLVNDHVVNCFTFYSVMLRDDVLIENNKYGCVIMQNNEAMKIVNFTHVQTAEIRHSFYCCSSPRRECWYEANCSAILARIRRNHSCHEFIVRKGTSLPIILATHT